MKMVLAYLTLLSFPIPQTVNALTISKGEDLQNACKVAEHFSACVSYLKLIHDTAKAIARMNDPEWRAVVGSCGPDKGIDTVPLVVALRAAWKEYAEKHPGRLRNLAVGEVLLAFEEQWPCKR